jgi:glycosyltransferase involved in cell wall biosynthesis
MRDPELQVLMLADRFEVRGSSRQMISLARRLPGYGVRLEIVCTDATLLPRAQREGLTVRESRYLKSPLVGWATRHWLARELDERPPDVIHVQQRSMLPVGRFLAYRLERPYVVSIHDYLAPRETLKLDWIWCRRIIAVSDSVKAELKAQAGIDDERITVIHSGVETGLDEAAREVLVPQRAPVVGTAGPLEAAKGLRYFMDAVPDVLRAHPDAEFVIAGAGPEEVNLRRQVRELGVVEHVTFVPDVMELSQSLSAMDIFVLPSLKQGLGTIMLEAMLRGRPVIATSAGGVYSVVTDNRTGLLVPPRDSAALARRIVELLDDPLRARQIGRAAQDMVRREFPVERTVQQTARLYREIAPRATVPLSEALHSVS